MKAEFISLLSFAFLAFLLGPGCASKEARKDWLDDELREAISGDDAGTVAKIIRKVSPDYRIGRDDSLAIPLITEAAEQGAVGVLKLLLREGADKEQRMAGDIKFRPLEWYLIVEEDEADERIVALLRRDSPNTPQEEVFELLEVTFVGTFLGNPPVPFRLSVSGLPPAAGTGELLEGLARKGYLISRDSQNPMHDSIEIVFDKVDETTYMVEVYRNKDIPLGSAFWRGKLERRYGYWMYSEIDCGFS